MFDKNGFVGFSIENGKRLKLFNLLMFDPAPKNTGSDFLLQFAQMHDKLNTPEKAENYFGCLTLIDEEAEEDRYDIQKMKEKKEKIQKGDFTKFHPRFRKRFRSSFLVPAPIYLPSETEDIKNNLANYKWGYVLDLDNSRVEFYGNELKNKGYLIGSLLEVEIPYYASMSINSPGIILAFGTEINEVDFLERNHEQELILQESLNKKKPHNVERKKRKRRMFL